MKKSHNLLLLLTILKLTNLALSSQKILFSEEQNSNYLRLGLVKIFNIHNLSDNVFPYNETTNSQHPQYYSEHLSSFENGTQYVGQLAIGQNKEFVR